jgi:radical SAM-linked protein
VEISYAKRGKAKYFGHLELVNIFTRALRRAGLPVKFTQGFHPKPKISFHDPLPVGMESEKNSFCLALKNTTDNQNVISSLNAQLPEGLSILDCRTVAPKSIPALDKTALYMISISEDEYSSQKLKEFNDADEWIFHRTTRKGREKQIDLKEVVLNIERLSATKLKLHVKVVPEMRVRPNEVIGSIFHFSNEVIRWAKIVKKAY